MLQAIFYLLIAAVGFIGLIAIVMFVTVAIPFWRMANNQKNVKNKVKHGTSQSQST